MEVTWVEDKSTHTFHGGFEMEQLPLLRKKGKQREQSSRCTVITPGCTFCLHLLIRSSLNNWCCSLPIGCKVHCQAPEQVVLFLCSSRFQSVIRTPGNPVWQKPNLFSIKDPKWPPLLFYP